MFTSHGAQGHPSAEKVQERVSLSAGTSLCPTLGYPNLCSGSKVEMSLPSHHRLMELQERDVTFHLYPHLHLPQVLLSFLPSFHSHHSPRGKVI